MLAETLEEVLTRILSPFTPAMRSAVTHRNKDEGTATILLFDKAE